MVIDFVKEQAFKMKNPDDVRERVCISRPDKDDGMVSWGSLTLSDGYPGVLLLFSTLDQLYPQEGWDQIAHLYVVKIKEAIEQESVSNLSLFGGLAGCCFSIEQASREGERYQKLLSRLDQFLIEKSRIEYLEKLDEKIEMGLPAHPGLYDVISGLCGIGGYALHRLKSPGMNRFFEEILKTSIRFISNIQIGVHLVPGWYVPRHYQYTKGDEKLYPKGNFNLGLAHGVTGFLALFSLAATKGVVIDNQMEAIRTLSHWVLSKKREVDGHVFWKDRVSFEEETSMEGNPEAGVTLDAWCYGTAGVARTLFLAGKAIKSDVLKQEAVEGFLSIFNRISFIEDLRNPTFCHGISGLMTLAQLMLRDSGVEKVKTGVLRLKQTLMDLYNPEFIFGFRDKEPVIKDAFTLNGNAEGKPVLYQDVDKAGLLVGASGILLSLLFTETNQSSWTIPFLIEGGTI